MPQPPQSHDADEIDPDMDIPWDSAAQSVPESRPNLAAFQNVEKPFQKGITPATDAAILSAIDAAEDHLNQVGLDKFMNSIRDEDSPLTPRVLAPLLLSSQEPVVSSGGGAAAEPVQHPTPREASTTSSCFRLREVTVDKPPEESGDLGLLLSGTIVVAFTCPGAELAGWQMGDQIVKVNGASCVNFEQFLKHFMDAKSAGYPIVFSVLRCELKGGTLNTECDVDEFFDSTNLVELAEQMQTKFGVLKEGLGPYKGANLNSFDVQLQGFNLSGRESMLENPYIEALRKRRNNLTGCAEGWSSGAYSSSSTEGSDGSLAAQLASQREDGIATLTPNKEKEKANERVTEAGPCGILVMCSDPDNSTAEGKASNLPLRVHKVFTSPCLASRMKLCGSSAEPEAETRPPPSVTAIPCLSTKMEICSSPDRDVKRGKSYGDSICLETRMDIGGKQVDNSAFLDGLPDLGVAARQRARQHNPLGRRRKKKWQTTVPMDILPTGNVISRSGSLLQQNGKKGVVTPQFSSGKKSSIPTLNVRTSVLETVREDTGGDSDSDYESSSEESSLGNFRKVITTKEPGDTRNVAMQLLTNWGPSA